MDRSPLRRFRMDWAARGAAPPRDDAAMAPGHPPVADTLAGLDLPDEAVNGPAARSDYDVTGAGLRIGILSDSFDVLGGAAAAEREGLLPADGVTVLEEGPAGSTDEGQAMAELVYQTAPGAQLYFYSGVYSEQDMANGITALQNAGCHIIVDDITWPDEPMFQIAGPIDTAVQNAIAAGVDYFTAVGNEGDSFYQSLFTPVSTVIPGVNGGAPVLAEFFSNGTALQPVSIPAAYAVTLTLDWDASFNSPQPDPIVVDVLNGNTVVATSSQSYSEPEVFVEFPLKSRDVDYGIAVLENPGGSAPTYFKYVLEGGGTILDGEAGIGSGSAIGHALVPGANAVGAVDVTDTPAEGGTPVPESYSSTGPGVITLAPDGTPLATPQIPGVPQFLAPDGGSTSVFDPFFGTSAAAPVAAATAALMLQANPGLDPADVTTLLEDSAIPAGAASVAGAGLIQANLAVGYASTDVISGSPQMVITGTAIGGTILGGTGTHEIIAGSGNTSIISAGNDTVLAGAGTDTVALTGATAQLTGSTGPLFVSDLGGADTVTGGGGAIYVAAGGAGGGLEVGGSGGGSALTAGSQPTTLVAAGGNNTLSGGSSDGGNTFEVGGAGGDLVQATGPDNSILVASSNNSIVLGAGVDVGAGVAGPVAGAIALMLADGTRIWFPSVHLG
jgi:hypothetical protein